MRLGDRGILEQVARSVGDLAVEALGALIHTLERRGRGQKLECAAHREPFIGAMLDRCARSRVAHEDAEPAALARFHVCEPLVREGQALLGRRGGSRGEGERRDREGGKERTTVAMMHI